MRTADVAKIESNRMTERKRPGVVFWATVVVVCLLAYPLSFGPACWITSRLDRGADLVPVAYRPFTWAMSPQSDTTIDSVINWYAEVGAAENWAWGSISEAGETPGSEHVRWMWVEIFPAL
jgi:hypothetical protein